MNFAVEHTVNLLKINLGINDLKKEREHVKNLIIKTDERIDKLMRELRKTEPKTQESIHIFYHYRNETLYLFSHLGATKCSGKRTSTGRSCNFTCFVFRSSQS